MELEGTVGLSGITGTSLAVNEVSVGERVASGAGPGWDGTRRWGCLSGGEQRNQSHGTGPWGEPRVVKHLVGFEAEKDRSESDGTVSTGS